LITELERAHLEWSSLAASSQWRPKGSYASPRQTLNIIRTAIIPSLSYAFAVTPCSYPNLDKSDAMIGRVIKSKHNLWQSTLLAAMIREDVHSFGLGAPSIYVEYHRRSAVALETSLEDPSERHQSVTMNLLTHQVAQLKALATTFLSTIEGTLLPIKWQFNLHMRARQLACIHASKLHLALKGNSLFLNDLKSHLRPTLATLINCINKLLMDIGITGFHDLTSANKKYIVSGKQLRNNTVKKPRVINAFMSFISAFMNQKRERENFEAFQTVL